MEVKKPNIGDVLKLTDPDASTGDPGFTHGVVIEVFDSLGEDWGDFGHDAMAQGDHDQVHDMIGKAAWYAIVTMSLPDGTIETEAKFRDTLSLASWEVTPLT